MVSFQSGDQRLEAYLARPEGEGPFPGVVAIHEALGLNDNIKDISQRFAGEGYVALAVDLFATRNRAVCMARIIGGTLRGSPDRFGVPDLKAALGVLAEQPSVDAQRLGAIGFCMGGGFAIAWACTDDRLRAVAPYYGTNPRPLSAVARSCPLVGSYPEKDFTARSARKLEAELERHSVPHDVKIYAGARHSFLDRKSTRLNSSHANISYAVFCLKKKKKYTYT